jgi:phosphoribosyl-AMP cyclohydrolase
MKLDFTKLNGLLPAVVQDEADGRVLVVGFMNEEAFQKTVETGQVTFFSRSRNELWTKGRTSGHYLLAKEILVDCDEDTLVVKVEALGPGVCHNGFRSCFYRRFENGAWKQVDQRSYDPKSVYKSSGA